MDQRRPLARSKKVWYDKNSERRTPIRRANSAQGSDCMHTIGDLVELFKVLFDFFAQMFDLIKKNFGKEEEEEATEE